MQLHGRFFTGANHGQRTPVALFDQGAQCMPGDPRGVRIFQRPAFQALQHPVRMGFCDVVQVVGHRLAYIQAFISLEVFKNGRSQAGIGHQRIEAKRPGQARAAAFTGQAPDMLAFITRPSLHHGQSARRVASQEFAYGELRSTEGGEKFQRLHRCVEIMVAIQADVIGQHQRHKAAVDARRQLAQDANRLFIVGGQGGTQAFRHAAQALHQRERAKVGQGQFQKMCAVKTRVDGGGFRRHMAETVGVEDVLECRCGGWFCCCHGADDRRIFKALKVA